MKEEQQQLDPRLERLALGELSAEERRKLDEDAKSDPELASAIALYAPLSAESRARLAREVKAPARVIPLRRIVAAASIAAAAAVAGALWLQIDRGPVPRYALAARAGDVELRGEAPAPQERTLRADSMIEIVLAPEVPADEVDAKLYIREGGELVPSSASAQISEDGAVRWVGRAETLAGGRIGPVTFVAKVGRAGESPGAWQAMTLEVEIRAAGGAP
jgi:hypothetical protein